MNRTDQRAPFDGTAGGQLTEHPEQAPAQEDFLPPGFGDDSDGPPTNPIQAPPGGRRRLVIRLLVLLLALGLLGATGVVVGAMWLQHSYNANIERFGDPFKDLGPRPAVVAGNAQNILLLGSDTRISAGDASTWSSSARRTDAIMIAHIPSDRSFVTLSSIPRDSWVNVPGHGMDRINAGFSYGGPKLMVKTVEQYTGVHIDHVVILDFGGFQKVTDALGGVTVDVPAAALEAGDAWKAGSQTMDGQTALKYVSQHHKGRRADLERVRRQQSWIRAIAGKTLGKGTMTNPLKLNDVLSSISKATAVDNGFTVGEMRDTLLSLREVHASDITFVTAPIASTGKSPDGTQNIVRLDKSANQELWRAVRNDEVSAWLAAH